jgi:prepilin-type N-terminal cleavage/methylation domain-containing protein
MHIKRANPSAPAGSRDGFTLVELLIVVVILAILAVIAIPFVQGNQDDAEARVFVTNIRYACDQFKLYRFEEGRYPADVTPGVVPTGMAERLTPLEWTSPTPITGRWDWDYKQYHFTAGVSVFKPNRDANAIAERVDAILDDGDLATGGFRSRDDGYIQVVEF